MKSNIYQLRRLSEDYRNIPAGTERFARYNGLDDRSALRLRLLSEELICMLPQLLIYGAGSYWVENNGSTYELHISVTPDADVLYDSRRVLAVSRSGKNAAAKGIISKIVIAVESMIESKARAIQADSTGIWALGLSDRDDSGAWSLVQYRSSFSEESVRAENPDDWDELEKSIIANLADDVQVGIIGGKIDISVVMAF